MRTTSKKTKETMTPITFELPESAVKEMKERRDSFHEEQGKSLEEVRSSVSELGNSMLRHRMETHAGFQRHRSLSDGATQELKSQIEGIGSDLDEAFSVVWNHFDELKSSVGTHGEKLSKVDEKHAKAISEAVDKISGIERSFEKKHQVLLKRIRLAASKGVEIKLDDTEIKSLQKGLESLRAEVKKAATYEYGQQVQILNNGKLVAQVQGINFVPGSGTTVTVSASKSSPGFADVKIDAAGSATSFVDNEVISGSGTSWTLTNTPVAGSEHIFGEGQRLTPGGVDYTIIGKTITTVNPFSAGTLLADYRK